LLGQLYHTGVLYSRRRYAGGFLGWCGRTGQGAVLVAVKAGTLQDTPA
jgi:isochorismate synthase EntC